MTLEAQVFPGCRSDVPEHAGRRRVDDYLLDCIIAACGNQVRDGLILEAGSSGTQPARATLALLVFGVRRV